MSRGAAITELGNVTWAAACWECDVHVVCVAVRTNK